MNAQELKTAAKQFGADLIGIADIQNLKHLPPKDNPLSIFPQATNVIVIGRKIPRGTLRGIEQGTEFDNFLLPIRIYDTGRQPAGKNHL